jgi:hypothetical protein
MSAILCLSSDYDLNQLKLKLKKYKVEKNMQNLVDIFKSAFGSVLTSQDTEESLVAA